MTDPIALVLERLRYEPPERTPLEEQTRTENLMQDAAYVIDGLRDALTERDAEVERLKAAEVRFVSVVVAPLSAEIAELREDVEWATSRPTRDLFSVADVRRARLADGEG